MPPELTILVAEDEPVVALELEGTLRGAGYGVLGPVATAAEGFELLAARTPDVALVNARLADGSAAALVAALLAAGALVGLATGYGDGELELVMRELPILRKPHSPRHVVAFLRQLTARD